MQFIGVQIHTSLGGIAGVQGLDTARLRTRRVLIVSGKGDWQPTTRIDLAEQDACNGLTTTLPWIPRRQYRRNAIEPRHQHGAAGFERTTTFTSTELAVGNTYVTVTVTVTTPRLPRPVSRTVVIASP